MTVFTSKGCSILAEFQQLVVCISSKRDTYVALAHWHSYTTTRSSSNSLCIFEQIGNTHMSNMKLYFEDLLAVKSMYVFTLKPGIH